MSKLGSSKLSSLKRLASKPAAPPTKKATKEKEHKAPKPVTHKDGETVFKSPEEAERAAAVGVACEYKTRKDGKETIHVAALRIGPWDFDLEVADEATARGMAKDIASTLEKAVEERVKEAVKEALKAKEAKHKKAA